MKSLRRRPASSICPPALAAPPRSRRAPVHGHRFKCTGCRQHPSSRGNLSTSGSVGSLPIIHPDSKQCVQRPARLVPRSCGPPPGNARPCGRSLRRARQTCRAAPRPAARRGLGCRAPRSAPGRPSRKAAPRPSGLATVSWLMTGSGTCTPTGSSRRAARECSMFRHTRGDDRRQPAAQVLHLVRSGAAQTQPGVLHGVAGLGQRAEHPVGDGPQMRSLLLETPGQPLLLVYRSHSSVATGHR